MHDLPTLQNIKDSGAFGKVLPIMVHGIATQDEAWDSSAATEGELRTLYQTLISNSGSGGRMTIWFWVADVPSEAALWSIAGDDYWYKQAVEDNCPVPRLALVSSRITKRFHQGAWHNVQATACRLTDQRLRPLGKKTEKATPDTMRRPLYVGHL